MKAEVYDHSEVGITATLFVAGQTLGGVVEGDWSQYSRIRIKNGRAVNLSAGDVLPGDIIEVYPDSDGTLMDYHAVQPGTWTRNFSFQVIDETHARLFCIGAPFQKY